VAFVPVALTAEVTTRMTDQDQNVVNVFHVRNTVAWTLASITLLAEAVRTWWETQTRNERNSNTCLQEVCARDLSTATGIGVCVPHGLLNCGADVSNPVPGNVTLAIKNGSGFTGRSQRGRTYWVGLSEGIVNGNTVDSTWQGQVLQNMGELRTAIINLGYEFVVVSRHTGRTCDVVKCKKIPTPRSVGVTTPITGFTADLVVDSQRRRLPGRGA